MNAKDTTFNLELNARAGKKGLHEVYLRITQDRKHKRIKLGISVKKADFNKKAKYGKWVRERNPDHKVLNDALVSKDKDARARYREMEEKGQGLTLQNIKQGIKNQRSDSFMDFAKKQYQYFSTSTRYSYSFTRHFNTIIFNKLQKFTESKGIEDLQFSDLTLSFLKDYESYLSGLGNKVNTIHKNMGFIKALVNDAIEEGIIKPEASPFLHYKLKKTKSSKDKMNWEEIKKIEEVELPEGSLLWHTRNMFLFSFYQAGIRASDCIKMKWGNIVNDRLIYSMDKVDKPVNLMLTTRARDLLNLYRRPGIKKEDFIFPLLDNGKKYTDRAFLFSQVSSKNALLNKYLRKVAEKAEVRTFSFHIARHSFASIAKEMGVSTDMISELLNHSSPAITKVYLKGFENQAMDNALELIQEGGRV